MQKSDQNLLGHAMRYTIHTFDGHNKINLTPRHIIEIEQFDAPTLTALLSGEGPIESESMAVEFLTPDSAIVYAVDGGKRIPALSFMKEGMAAELRAKFKQKEPEKDEPNYAKELEC